MHRPATLLLGFLFIGSAWAQEDKKTDDLKPADPDTGESTVEETTLGLLPRPFERWGIKFAATYIGEALGNPSGGLKRGSVYEGRLNLAVDVDFEKLAGLRELTFHANMFQIHGGGLSRGALLNFMDVSGIEALPSTRLYEAWFERKWGSHLALRAGQLAADTEFMTAKYTDVFTNASLGWPAGLSLNLPGGGPSPPLAAVGARLRADLSDNLTVLGAVFNGDSAGPGPDDPQLRNRYGVNFRINDPPLVLGEAQFLWNAKKGDPGLDGKIKLGGWRHFGLFNDQRFDGAGVSLADTASNGMPGLLRGDFGLYAVAEQKIYRVGGDDDRGIGVFARASYSPPDRNLINYYADTGIEFIGLTDGRPKDKFGVAAAYAHVSPRARALDLDFQRLVAPARPARSFEGLLTAVYQYEIRAGWTLQPNFQFIVHPGGGATNPLSSLPGKALKNAEVFGLRTVLKF
ncbi:carbohydrate porin [Bradyrhizobium sp. McL0615]|uniref:carbohydrate porin n=1 Tax=Bradyrhizobium sp. McL0615 TaxID=3415673 RepID=UPI003CF5D7E9